MDLLAELERSVLCGDGAMGTILLEAGMQLERCFEELCLSEPDRIRKIHEEYIAAGARVIETNTFGANAVRLERFGMRERVSQINRAAVAIAQEAAKGRDVFVAGSVGPLGITAEEANARNIDRKNCFREQITALLEGGVQLIFFETFQNFGELEIAFRAKTELSDVPAICSFACGPGGRLPCGLRLEDAFGRLRDLGAKIFGINCMNGPHEMVQLLRRVGKEEYLLSVYPTAGNPQHQAGGPGFVYPASPADFAKTAREMIAAGGRLIGGCCGTTPAHVAAIAGVIADLKPSKQRNSPAL